MGKLRNIDTHIGKRFGPFVVIKRNKRLVKNNTLWDCRCDCGAIRTMFFSNLSRAKKCTCHYQHEYHILNQIFTIIKQSAKKREIYFSKKITKDYLLKLLEKQEYKCALSGLKLQIGKYHKHIETTASLDRIDSSKEYTINNIQWVHKDINKLKNIFPQTKFIKLCKKVSEYN
jgi:hypothetical protein